MSHFLIPASCVLLAAILAWLARCLRPASVEDEGEHRMDRIRNDFGRYTLFTALVFPLVFVVVYQAFGLILSVVVWLMILAGRKAFEVWRWRLWGGPVANFIWVLGLALGVATLHMRDAFYLQMIPVLVAATIAAYEAVRPMTVKRAGPRPVPAMEGEEETVTARRRPLRPVFMVVLFAGAALFYEYLRRTASLDTWIWVFAFVRVELVLAIVGGLMPFGIYAGWKAAKAYEPPPEA